MNETVEQPAAPDSVAATPEAASDDLELVDGLPDEQQTEDEIEEELEGVKVKGKKDLIEKLRAERLMQADYTKKTQALAEERRVAEEIRTSLHVQQQIRQSLTEDLADLRAIDKQLSEFQKVNMAALIEQDPSLFHKLNLQKQTLQEQRSQVANALAQKEQQALAQHQASLATLVEKAESYLAREVKGWSPERSNALAEYAVKEGFPRAALPNITAHMPAFGKVLHKAEMYDRLVERQKAAKSAPAQAAPVTTLTAHKASAQKDPDKMSVEEWTKWRNSQLRRK